MNKTTRNIVTAAVIGALYAVLTMVLAPISYGPVQCRISEVLGMKNGSIHSTSDILHCTGP